MEEAGMSFLLLDIIKVEEQLAGILQREFKKQMDN